MMKHPIAFLIGLILTTSPVDVLSFGGLKGTLDRMEIRAQQLAQTQELSIEEQAQWKNTIQKLRQRLDQRLQENGGWVNVKHDHDLYEEIDQYNKQLYTQYKNSKAIQRFPPERLGSKRAPLN